MAKTFQHLRRVAGALALAPFALAAQEGGQLFDETAFQQETEGQVFDIFEDGVLRQREEFLGDGRVRLGLVPEGQSPQSLAPLFCREGIWYMEGDAICFLYDLPDGGESGPHCWRIYDLGDGRQRAESALDQSQLVLDAQRTDTPLICLGPEVGV